VADATSFAIGAYAVTPGTTPASEGVTKGVAGTVGRLAAKPGALRTVG
jgi:hypothetical protein